MDVFDHLVLGFSTALSLHNLGFCFVGVLLGTLIGVLPGVGPTTTVAILLPMTFGLPGETSLIMLAGIYYGAQYGGSTTAILINLPGEPSSVVTAIDGHQMALQGRAGPALATAALGSFFAGTVATFAIVFLSPMLVKVALSFSAREYFALIVLGLIVSVVLAHGSVVKAIAMMVLGLLFGLVGTDVYTAAPRYTFGFFELTEGIDFIAITAGIFGIAEIMKNLENISAREVVKSRLQGLIPSWAELKSIIAPVLRGTTLGTVLGVLPGSGATLSSFAAYALEKKLSATPERFGHGAIEGVASPEAANNAGAQASFIPMLSLGIPANAIMALMVAAMIMQGIVPGPGVATQQPQLFWGIIASMWIGNAMLLVLNLPLLGLWIRLLKIPYQVLFPAILMFASIGVYSVNMNIFDVITMTLFGLFGYILLKLDCEPAPLVLGFILGPMLEDHFRRSMILSRGDPFTFFYSPISCALLLVALFALALSLVPVIAARRREVFVEED